MILKHSPDCNARATVVGDSDWRAEGGGRGLYGITHLNPDDAAQLCVEVCVEGSECLQ